MLGFQVKINYASYECKKMTKLKWVDVLFNFNRAACIKTNSTEMKINGASISPSSRENNIFGVTLSVEKLN
jgi:hypothetical protein